MVTADGRIVCDECGKELSVGEFPFCNGSGYGHGYVQRGVYDPPAVHPTERTVVYENPQTGKIRYPGRNDVPIPQRYAEQGYVKKEFTSRRELESFEKKHKVTNDKLWYNSGNTHASENMRND